IRSPPSPVLMTSLAYAPTRDGSRISAAARVRGILQRDWVLAALAGVLFSAVMNYPALLALGRGLPAASGDPLSQARALGWAGDALLHAPSELFQANLYGPNPDSLAHTDALLGYAPAALFAHGERSLLTVYGLMFLFTYAFSFAGAFLLAREVRLSRV